MLLFVLLYDVNVYGEALVAKLLATVVLPLLIFILLSCISELLLILHANITDVPKFCPCYKYIVFAGVKLPLRNKNDVNTGNDCGT